MKERERLMQRQPSILSRTLRGPDRYAEQTADRRRVNEIILYVQTADCLKRCIRRSGAERSEVIPVVQSVARRRFEAEHVGRNLGYGPVP